MKTRNNITVYQCDFCSKKLFRKQAMEKHEIKCSSNPANIRACFDCEFCEKVSIMYEPESYSMNSESIFKASFSFKCNKKEVFMYPPKVEHGSGIPSYVLHKGEEILQEPMPLKCEFQKPIEY